MSSSKLSIIIFILLKITLSYYFCVPIAHAYKYHNILIIHIYYALIYTVLGPVPPTLQHIGFEKLNNPTLTSSSSSGGSTGEGGGKTGDDAKKEPVKPKTLFERYVSYSILVTCHTYTCYSY